MDDNLPRGCIALEEHAAFSSLGDDHASYDGVWKAFPGVRDRLRDLQDRRLSDMDSGHVDFQVISQVSGIVHEKSVEACRAANDELFEAVKRNPTRFGGFAALNMGFPEEAARELERCVTELGFVGAMIDSHLSDMTHYDDEKFWPVFEAAERLDVPVYIHPGPPSDRAMGDRFVGNYERGIAGGIGMGAWGWHEDVGLHVLKLYGAGLFSRFPKLKIVIGHMGELLPIMIDRIDSMALFPGWERLERFSGVWERNIWVTTSGPFSVRTLEMVLKVTKLERVLYSVDTPFMTSEKGWRFVEEIAKSGLLSKNELEMLTSGNARKLLKLPQH